MKPVAMKQGKLLVITQSYVMIACVVRIIVTVRLPDLFKAFGVNTLLEVGLLSVEPTHTGRGMQTCLIAGYRRNYISLLTTWYLFFRGA